MTSASHYLAGRSPAVTAQSSKEGLFHKKAIYLWAGFIGLVCHLLFGLPTYTLEDRILAWLPLVMLLALLHAHNKRSKKSIPLVLLVGLQVYLFYSVPQFSQEEIPLWGAVYTPSPAAITTSMVLVVSGEIAFILAYYLAPFIGGEYLGLLYRRLPTPVPAWKQLVVPYSILGFVIYFLRALRPDYIPLSISYLASQLFNIYLGLTLLLYLGYVFKMRHLLGLARVLAIAMAAVGFIQGMLGVMLAPCLVLFLAAWFWRNTLNVGWIILAGLMIVTINPVKNEFRVLAWKDKDVSSIQRVEERLDDWVTSFSHVWIDRTSDDSPLNATASRTSDLLGFAQAIDYVPSIIPFRYGEGLSAAMFFWVPRIIWPSKGSSSDLLHNRYAVQFGYTTEEGLETTTVGASIFTEGYWNFGAFGVLAFLMLSGLIYGLFLGRNANDRRAEIVSIVFIAPQIFVLQALTVTIASLFSFIIGIVIAMFAIHWTSMILLNPVSRPRFRT